MTDIKYSLKIYRDLKRAFDTAFGDGKIKEILKRNLEMAKALETLRVANEIIPKTIGVSEEQINNLGS